MTSSDAGRAAPSGEGIRIAGNVVYTQTHLGKGGFGVVHLGKDLKGMEIAAKCVKRVKLRRVQVDLEKLLSLGHANIVKMFNIHHDNEDVWVFMEYCEYGDLNSYFGTHVLSLIDFINVMIDSATGVQYLHSNNVIHRDVKPANILITRHPPVAKLTDFDVCKFLENPYDTSLCTTNVGTEAFKAPEFYQRNANNKLEYHRNVDVYALGLTYLAMIQGLTSTSQLRPRIETPGAEGDEQKDIGRLIELRMRLGTGSLDVMPEPAPPNGVAQSVEAYLRRLIYPMTRFLPKERLPVGEVVQELRRIRETARPVTTRLLRTLDTGLVFWEWTQFTVLPSGIAAFWGKSSVQDAPKFHFYRGTQTSLLWHQQYSVAGLCPHEIINLTPGRARTHEFLGVSCGMCQNIKIYNMSSGEVKIIFRDPRCYPGALTLLSGPPARVYAVQSRQGDPSVLQLNCAPGGFNLADVINSGFTHYHSMCHVPKHRYVAIGDCDSGLVRAVSLEMRGALWEFSRAQFHPHGMTYAPRHDVVIVADATLVVLNARDGSLRQTVALGAGLGVLAQPCWVSHHQGAGEGGDGKGEDQLVLWHAAQDNQIKISFFACS